MKFFLLITLFLFISAEPISRKDREIVILYKCNLNGEYHFDEDGRGGISTISSIKKIEEENQKDHRGGVFLFSSGAFSEKKEKLTGIFELIAFSGFDGSFVSEQELKFLEDNPNKKNLSLPVLAHRENSSKYSESKKFKIENLEFQVSHILQNVEDTNLNFELIFPQIGDISYIQNFIPSKPTYFFLNSNDSSNFGFNKKNLYLLDCPQKKDLGKLSLFFRDKKLIRQKQSFIPLNSKEQNQNWISPDRTIIKYLE